MPSAKTQKAPSMAAQYGPSMARNALLQAQAPHRFRFSSLRRKFSAFEKLFADNGCASHGGFVVSRGERRVVELQNAAGFCQLMLGRGHVAVQLLAV